MIQKFTKRGFWWTAIGVLAKRRQNAYKMERSAVPYAGLGWDNGKNRRGRMRRAKQTNKKSPDNNEHSPDWFRCITHRLSPHCLFSTLPGVPAVQKSASRSSCRAESLKGEKIEPPDHFVSVSQLECHDGFIMQSHHVFFLPKTDGVKGHMEMIHSGVYWRTLWVITCRHHTVSQIHGANLVNMVFTAAQVYTEIYWTTRLQRSIHLPVSRAT